MRMITTRMAEEAEAKQKECHEFINLYVKQFPNCKDSYQDLTNVWLFMEISRLEKEILRLNG